jgi:methylmalonyl-CoA mutase
MLQELIANNLDNSKTQIEELQHSAIQNQNIFEVMMEAAKICSLGQISNSLFEVGGQYRRNM